MCFVYFDVIELQKLFGALVCCVNEKSLIYLTIIWTTVNIDVDCSGVLWMAKALIKAGKFLILTTCKIELQKYENLHSKLPDHEFALFLQPQLEVLAQTNQKKTDQTMHMTYGRSVYF